MAIEIERKFLVKKESWRALTGPGQEMQQGYILNASAASVRVRVAGEDAWLTVKGRAIGATRREYEYPIPVTDAREMLQSFCAAAELVTKTRFRVPWAGHTWEVDVFAGENHGLVVAELELESEDQVFEIPPWVGADITHDHRYLNASLSQRPWRQWSDAECRCS
jgi:CYTH domain-containing protein